VKICPRCSESGALVGSPLFGDEASFCSACGGGLAWNNDPHLGRTIAARYRLIKRLGVGGMSSVYLARHVIIERLSAIKILRQELSTNLAHRERFLREARAVNRINHENIVEITDFGESDGVTYLVMEFIEGQTLLTHLQRGAFAWQRAASIALQIASALARAHEAGIIHRDLKPENVLLLTRPDRDVVKLTDFGIAKIVDAPALTFNSQLFGTPGYIAPEYVEAGITTPASDVYSLGVVLYEMVTAKMPFDARGQAELLFFPLTRAPIPPSQRVRAAGAPAIPPEIESLVLRMIARRPEERPRDAFQICDALQDALLRSPTRAPRSAPPPAMPPVSSGAERDEAPTVFEHAMSSPPAAPPLLKVPTPEMSSRWHAALLDLNASIGRARAAGGGHAAAAAHAAALVERAADIVSRLERVSRAAGDNQARVDLLEANAREFRANLGRAIDVLVRDRSRELAHLEALRDAQMRDEEARARTVVDDLTFQIETLHEQLDAKNEEHDRALTGAAGALEGSISALRVMQSELVRSINEASAVLAAVR
jgi:eukaryotic-like serine/threonine-protein kinase